MFTPPQCRGARGILDWTQDRLATEAQVSLSTVKDFEAGRRTPIANNMGAMQGALEAAGIEFTNGGQPGVKIAFVLGTCSECGMRAKVAANETTLLDPASKCAHKGKPLACPAFKAAVSGAHQVLRKV
jgi:hypothetical protein